MFGPDVPASVTLDELGQLVEGIRFIEKMRQSPVDKNALAKEMQPLRDIFTRSVVANADLPAGTVLRREHLASRKPGTGIPGNRLPELVGRRLCRAVIANQLLREDDLVDTSQGSQVG